MCWTCGCDNYAEHTKEYSVRKKSSQTAHPGEQLKPGKALKQEQDASHNPPGTPGWLKKKKGK